MLPLRVGQRELRGHPPGGFLHAALLMTQVVDVEHRLFLDPELGGELL